jgi:hypothetical protein
MILSRPIDDGYRVYKFLNRYQHQETWLDVFKLPKSNAHELYDAVFSMMGDESVIKTGLIGCQSTPDELIDRINKLLIFS